MKFLKRMFVTFLIIGCVGYTVYFFGSNFVYSQVADSISTDLDNQENLDVVQQVVNSNANIKEFIDEGAHIDESNLPFTTKEQATKVVVQKLGINELQKLQTRFQNGISEAEVQNLLHELEASFTEEEIMALKAIAYKEFKK